MADGNDVSPTAGTPEPTVATAATDLHRSKIPGDDPRLNVDRPRSRTLRKGPVIAAVLALGGIVAVAIVVGLASPSNEQADAKKKAEAETPSAGAAELPDVIRKAAVGSGGATASATSDQRGERPGRTPVPKGEPPAAAPRDALEQARQDELVRARAAGLFAPVDDSPVVEAPAQKPPSREPGDRNSDGAGAGAGRLPLDSGRSGDPNLQERKNDFLSKTGGLEAEYLEKTISPPRSPYEVKAGTVIPTVLITGLNSDLPGQVRENVYDSVSGNHLLIPQGSRLIASYDSMVAWGQERVLVCWNRLIRPDGTSLTLDCMPGIDLGGYAGFSDEIDNHWWKIITGATFSSLLAATAQRSQGDVTGFQPTISQVWAGNAAGQINQAGQQLTQKNLQIQPTITVRPGFSVNVLVSKDMIIPPFGR
jgi:type IV secretory pathway VirB10-like protein